ncbi:hypothetical protein [Alkalibacter mobilis]|uniref:hypothetical protein n=1 Tax=Alkalibacter mobilis TaxID=2787712 RepID=UPI00189D4F38|nr:hypothetical protein [Alkalibacter mobilis]MBF7097690.1 hypothetical protein [Alkalibacter mobilis]
MKTGGKFLGLLLTVLFLFYGCSDVKNDSPFTMSVTPEELKGFSISDQSIHYLVTVSDEAENDPVTITASATGANVTVVQGEIIEGQVAEVIVVPNTESVGKTVEVLIEGKRGSVFENKTMTFEVIEGEDDRKDYAEELLIPFVNYLSQVHPEFNITSETEWTGTIVSPQWLVVSHYLFFSDEWELHLEWHVMIAPSDWARIDLRHRFDEIKPSKAFEISSVSLGSSPTSIEVPAEIWR